MPGGHAFAGDTARALGLPQFDRLEHLFDQPVTAPQGQHVAGDLVATGPAFTVVIQVDAGAGAVILAGGVDRFGAAEATLVFRQRLWLDVRQTTGSPTAQL